MREKVYKTQDILTTNPVLDNALDCILYKIHPVRKFYFMKQDHSITAMHTDAELAKKRRELLNTSDEYKLFETQVKQCLSGFKKICKEYNLKF